MGGSTPEPVSVRGWNSTAVPIPGSNPVRKYMFTSKNSILNDLVYL